MQPSVPTFHSTALSIPANQCWCSDVLLIDLLNFCASWWSSRLDEFLENWPKQQCLSVFHLSVPLKQQRTRATETDAPPFQRPGTDASPEPSPVWPPAPDTRAESPLLCAPAPDVDPDESPLHYPFQAPLLVPAPDTSGIKRPPHLELNDHITIEATTAQT